MKRSFDNLPVISANNESAAKRYMLALFKKYCQEGVFFSAKQPDGELFSYYRQTMLLLDNAMNETDPDDDAIYTVISNLIQVASNVKSQKTQHRSQNEQALVFTTTRRNSRDLLSLIDEHWKISARLQRTRDLKAPASTKPRRLSRIATAVALSLSGLGTVVSGCLTLFYSNKANSVVPQKKDVIQQVGDIWNYQIRRMPTPMTMEEKWQLQGQHTARIASICFVIFLIIAVLKLFFVFKRRSNQNRLQTTGNDWQDLKYLEQVLDEVQLRINEEEQLWQEL